MSIVGPPGLMNERDPWSPLLSGAEAQSWVNAPGRMFDPESFLPLLRAAAGALFRNRNPQTHQDPDDYWDRPAVRLEIETEAHSLKGLAGVEAWSKVTIWEGDRPVNSVEIVGCGRSLEAAMAASRYFICRKLLIGHAAVCGVLLFRDGVHVELVALAPNDYLLKIDLDPCGADGLRVTQGRLSEQRTWTMPVCLATNQSSTDRTRYLHVRDIPRDFRLLFAHADDFSNTRLHRLICILRGDAVRGLHVHHLNGYGPDCRTDNLMPLSSGEHSGMCQQL